MNPNHPGPQDALDAGTIGDLTQDCREVPLQSVPPRNWRFSHRDISVPERAPRLLDGLSAYGC